MATPGRAVRIECGTSTSISQPKLFDYVAGSPAFNKTSARTTRSQTAATSNPPERDSERITNKQRKAEKKRLNKKSKKKNARNLSGGSSSSSQSGQVEDDSPFISQSRSFDDMLRDALSSQSDPNSSNTSNDTPPSSDNDIIRAKVYAEYLESQINSFKHERDILNSELKQANKSISDMRKKIKNLTRKNDELLRNASKKSGTRRFTDASSIHIQTDHPPVSPQESNDINIAKLNSMCDHAKKVAHDLLAAASSLQVPSTNTVSSAVPPPPEPLNTNATTSDQPFQTVIGRHNRRRQVIPPPANIQQIPVITSNQVNAQHIQVHTPSVPSYSDVTRHHRPVQGSRQRKKPLS